MDVQIARLAERVDAGFGEMSRRLDRQDATMTEIHRETRHTNGRVTRIEERIKTLFNDVRTIEGHIQSLFKAARDRAEALIHSLPREPRQASSSAAETPSERTGITRRDAAVFITGGGALIALWKFVEWANQMRHLP